MKPLTTHQRRALGAVQRGQITQRDGDLQHPDTISAGVLKTCRLRGWWRWQDTLAILTPEGRAALNAPIPDTPRLLAASVGRAPDDLCTRCGHVRGTHGTLNGEHADCLHAGCDCHRFTGHDSGDVDRGYITGGPSVIHDAGEAVDHRTQERLTADARQRDRDRRRAQLDGRNKDRELLATEDRLRELERDARLKHVDISGESWVAKQMLLKGRREAANRRIEKIERSLDQAA